MEEERVIRPSLLAADFLNLKAELDMLVELNIKYCHFDVMDGSFVDDISFGENIYKALSKNYPSICFDVHLMTVEPLKRAFSFARCNCKDITLHYESLTLGDLPRIKQLRNTYPDISLGIALSPETDVSELHSLLSSFDCVLVMSVVPGRGGQKYIQGSENKIKDLFEFRKNNSLNYKIGVDGGINKDNIKMVKDCGADYIVCGSSFFGGISKEENLKALQKALKGEEL